MLGLAATLVVIFAQGGILHRLLRQGNLTDAWCSSFLWALTLLAGTAYTPFALCVLTLLPLSPPSPTTSNDLRVYVGVSFSGILAWESLSLVYAIRPCLKTAVWCRVSGILRTTLRRNEAKAPLLSTWTADMLPKHLSQ